MVLNGMKTYIAATLAFAAAGYEIFVTGDMAKGYNYLIAGLGLAGLRNALSNK